MISVEEMVNNGSSTTPLGAQDRLDVALTTLESCIQRISEENSALKRELVEIRRQYRELEERYTLARRTNETVSDRLDKSIDQLKLLLDEA